MRLCVPFLFACALWAQQSAAQVEELRFPPWVTAGTAFSVPTSGSGSADLYIVGPAAALKRTVSLGESIAFGPDDLHTAGHYVATLIAGSKSQSTQFDVVPSKPARLSFIAKPSRLPVKLANAVSGVAYVFDASGNLVVEPHPVSFELSNGSGRVGSRTVTSKDGVAWVKMDSAPKAGAANFHAAVADAIEKRVVQQVPGDPCSIRMTARGSGSRVLLETDPVRDCSGNAVPDGTIVTFTETWPGSQSTVDVPLKRGVARTELPAHPGAVISVAAGVVMGNEIRWSGGL